MFIQLRNFLKRIFPITFSIFLCIQLTAQAPLSFQYQAVLRDAMGQVLANQEVEIGIAILQGSASGAEVFLETHSVTTNNFGLANLVIGSVNQSGIETIDWSAGPYFVQVYVDGTVMGASQLLSVPFAMHAVTVENDNVDDADPDPENELQDISLSGNELSITQGSTVILPTDEVDDADSDPTNEIQILSISGDTIFLTNGGYVKLPAGFNGEYSSLSGLPENLSEFTNDEGFITSPDDADADPTNELQDIIITGQELTITGGSSVLLPDEVDDADADPTNELQDISLSGTDLSITNGSTVDLSIIQDGTGTDNQRLSLGMNNQGKMRLNISDGNYVDMPFVKDGTNVFQWPGNNNYTAKWAGNGSIVKGSVYDNGNIGIGTETPGAKLEVAGQVKITGGSPGAGKVLTSGADGLASWETNVVETDPVFSAWDRSTGILINESQITDLAHFTTADEIDPQVGVNTTNYIPKWDGDKLVSGTIYDNGKIGIGTETPGAELEVAGQVKIVDGTQGTGKVLTSDANGLASWEAASYEAPGTAAGQMKYWNGTAWVTVASGSEGQVLTFASGVPTWKSQQAPDDVVNPITGKTWMDRNLGATQVATSSTDVFAYGDLYQWGRAADGHQIRNSDTTKTLSSSDDPGHDKFIVTSGGAGDWRNPQNDNLWQGVNGINNPCPAGYRVPTTAEYNAERNTWSSPNASGAFASPLKFVVAGFRERSNGSLSNVGTYGSYWSSNIAGTEAEYIYFSTNVNIFDAPRGFGTSIRCIKE